MVRIMLLFGSSGFTNPKATVALPDLPIRKHTAGDFLIPVIQMPEHAGLETRNSYTSD